jgi:STE24 endopeptidase
MVLAWPLDSSGAHDTERDKTIYSNEVERGRALRYSRIQEWLVLIEWAWSLLINIIALATGLSARLRTWAARIAPWRRDAVLPYATVVTILSFIASLPLSYCRGFVVEHCFELSNQTFRAWFGDQLKGLGVSLAIGVPLLQGAYWVIRRWPEWWWAILSALTAPFSVLMSALAPVLLLPLFNKFEPLHNRALAERIKALAAREGVHVADVLQMDMSRQTKKANAAFTGLGKTKRIVLGDTLLKEFSEDEVEVVIAHELGHQVHGDIWKLVALSAPVSVVSLSAAHYLAPPLITRFGARWGLDTEQGVADVAALPLLALIGGAALLVVMPILHALSRNFIEHPADRYALDLTGKRTAFISAMEKLGRMNLSNPQPSTLVKYLLYSHPPLQERINFARSYTSRKADR